MTFRPELIDELLKGYRNTEDLMGEDGIFKQLTKALIERCLSAELDTHLAEEKAELEADSLAEGNADALRIGAMDIARRRLKGSWVNLKLTSPATGMEHLRPS